MLASETLSDLVLQSPSFLIINYEQVYWEINQFFESTVNYNYCKSKFRTSQISKTELLEKIVKRFKDINTFYNNLHFRCLTGFQCTFEK